MTPLLNNHILVRACMQKYNHELPKYIIDKTYIKQ